MPVGRVAELWPARPQAAQVAAQTGDLCTLPSSHTQEHAWQASDRGTGAGAPALAARQSYCRAQCGATPASTARAPRCSSALRAPAAAQAWSRHPRIYIVFHTRMRRSTGERRDAWSSASDEADTHERSWAFEVRQPQLGRFQVSQLPKRSLPPNLQVCRARGSPKLLWVGLGDTPNTRVCAMAAVIACIQVLFDSLLRFG